jgi:hypothetical protein
LDGELSDGFGNVAFAGARRVDQQRAIVRFDKVHLLVRHLSKPMANQSTVSIKSSMASIRLEQKCGATSALPSLMRFNFRNGADRRRVAPCRSSPR